MIMTLINIRNLGVTLSTAAVFAAQPRRQRRRPDRACRRQRSRKIHPAPLHGRDHGASVGEITRSRGLRIGHVEQDVPDTMMERPFHAAVLEALSA